MFLWLYGAAGSQANHRVFRLCGTWVLYYFSLYYWWENHFHPWWGLWLNSTCIPVACGTGCLWLPSLKVDGQWMFSFDLCQLDCIIMSTSNQWQEMPFNELSNRRTNSLSLSAVDLCKAPLLYYWLLPP